MAGPLVDISLLGDKALERKLRRLTGAEQRAVVRKSLRSGAKRLLPHIQAATPRGDSGALSLDATAAKIRAVSRSRKRIGVQIIFGETISYESFVELGTRGQEGQPFIRATTKQHADPTLAAIAAAIATGLEKEGKR